MKCSKCGYENSEEDFYCVNCGNKLEQRVQPKKKNKLVIIIICIALLIAGGVGGYFYLNKGTSSKDYDTLIEEAEDYLENLDYDKAVDKYLEAIKIDPKNIDPYIEVAKIYATEEKYEDAVDILNDALEYASEDEDIETINNMINEYSESNSYKVGSTITLGNYKQGADGEVEPIEWIVLDKQDGKALLLSKDILEGIEYNDYYSDITWAKCSLNEWLDNDFYNEAFSEEEKKMILLTTVETPDNPIFGTDGGNACEDFVFCLSIQEIEQYFGVVDTDDYYWQLESKDALASASEYAQNNAHLFVNDSNNKSIWWTRSPGDSSVVFVDSTGRLNMAGSTLYDIGEKIGDGFVISNGNGVRPALWIEIQ